MSAESTAGYTSPGREPDVTHRQRFGLILVLAVGSIAGVFSYFGTRDVWLTGDRPPPPRSLPLRWRQPTQPGIWTFRRGRIGPISRRRVSFATRPASLLASRRSQRRSGSRSCTKWWTPTGRR